MARKPVASLKDTLLARKGEASPAHGVTPLPAGEALVKLTVKLTPEEHQRLLELGLRSRPRRSNQEMIREAVLQYLAAAEVENPGPTDQGWDGRRPADVKEENS
jgi:hypothetical protein